MKKLMIASAVILSGFALQAQITSANTVGYTTTTVKKNYPKTFAVTLTDVANPTGPIAIDKLFTIQNLKAATAFNDGMDQIWCWNTKVNGWVKYGYLGNPRAVPAIPDGWRKYVGPKTTDFAELTDDDVINPGETFLYRHGGTADAIITLSGQVKEFTASPSYVIKKNYPQFIAYPWPVEISLLKLGEIATFTNLKAATAYNDGMDQIWCWNTTVNGWVKYGYLGNPRAVPAIPDGWRKYVGPKTTDFAELTEDDKIAVGEGFLYRHGGTADLTITFKPLQAAE